MGELRWIGEDFGKPSKHFNAETYAAKKKSTLANIDPKTEYVVVDKIYCSACNELKSLDMPYRFFYTKCKCSCVERKAKAEEKRAERLARMRAYQAINEQVLPCEVQGASFLGIVNSKSSDAYITACSRCEKFCENFKAVKESGRGIWLYGGFDTGKTYIAAAILKRLQSDGVLVTFTTVERIFDEIKATYQVNASNTEQNIVNDYATVECLILDGFSGVSEGKNGTGRLTKQFCEIIRRRYDRRLPTVITSRSSIKDLFSEGALPKDIVNKFVTRMVPMHLVDNQRRPVQRAIEF